MEDASGRSPYHSTLEPVERDQPAASSQLPLFLLDQGGIEQVTHHHLEDFRYLGRVGGDQRHRLGPAHERCDQIIRHGEVVRRQLAERAYGCRLYTDLFLGLADSRVPDRGIAVLDAAAWQRDLS